jgi:dTDP-4-amino-4,6-dideoxygalactose transaminase
MDINKDTFQILQPKLIKLALFPPFWVLKDYIYVVSRFFKNNNQLITSNLKLKLQELHNIHFDNCFFFNSGKSSIYFAILATGVKEGDKVLIPSFTCRAVLFALLKAKVEPVFADIDKDYNLDLEKILKNDIKDIKAIVMPNMFGKINRKYTLIKEFQRKGIKVIEDNATSFGSYYENEITSDAIVFSFNIGKMINGSGGGAVFIKNQVDLKTHDIYIKPSFQSTLLNFIKMIFLSRYRKFLSLLITFIKRSNKNQTSLDNYYTSKDKRLLNLKHYFDFCQMSNLSLYLIDSQLKRFNNLKNHYLKLYKHYQRSFEFTETFKNNELPNYIVYEFEGISRYDLGAYLSKKGVEVSWSYFPIHMIKIYKDIQVLGDLKATNSMWNNFIYLPFHAFLKEKDIFTISDYCNKFMQTKNDK